MSLPKSQMLQLGKHFHCLSSCIQRLLSQKEGKELGAWLSIKWCPAMLSVCVHLWGPMCAIMTTTKFTRGRFLILFSFSDVILKANNRIVWWGCILKQTKITGSDFLIFHSFWLRGSRPMLTWELFGVHMEIQPSLPHPLPLHYMEFWFGEIVRVVQVFSKHSLMTTRLRDDVIFRAPESNPLTFTRSGHL